MPAVTESPGGWRPWARAVVVGTSLLLGVAACGGPNGGPGNDGPPTSSAGGPGGEFSVLSYNVAGLDQGLTGGNDPAARMPLISPLLNEYDIVLTQEDYDWFQGDYDGLDLVQNHERLRADATHEHRTGRHPGPQVAGLDPASRDLNVGDGLGIMSRFPFQSRYPLDDEFRVAWRGCYGSVGTAEGSGAECVSMKGFAMVTIQLDNTTPVDLYTFQGEGGVTLADQQLQAEDFEQLTEYIDQRSAGRAVIVGGDTGLNIEPGAAGAFGDEDSQIWATFLERNGLTDACDTLSCGDAASPHKIASRGDDVVTLTPVSHSFVRDTFTGPDGELSDQPPLAVGFSWRTGG